MPVKLTPSRVSCKNLFSGAPVHTGQRPGHLRRGRERHCVVQAVRKESYSRTAAERAVDAYIKDNSVVGLGHGTMVAYATEVIGQRLKQGILSGVTCLALSDIAVAEAAVQGVPLLDFQEESSEADITLIEADEIDCSGQRPSLITGRAPSEITAQQAQLPLLRTLISRSRECIGLVADAEAVVTRLGGSLPVVIEAEDWESIAEEVDDIFVGDAEVWRRSQTEGADPRGNPFPYVSPAGHNVLDVRFLSTLKLYGEPASYQQIINEIMNVKGVVTHGLFPNAIKAAVVASGPEAKIIEKGLMLGFRDEREEESP